MAASVFGRSLSGHGRLTLFRTPAPGAHSLDERNPAISTSAGFRKNHSRARPGRSRCKREPGSAQNRSVILNEVKNLISTVFHYVQHDKYPIIPYPLGIKKERLPRKSLFSLVELPGLEPGMTGPESVVLPLHHSSIFVSAKVAHYFATAKNLSEIFHIFVFTQLSASRTQPEKYL